MGLETVRRVTEVFDRVIRCDWSRLDEQAGVVTLCDRTTPNFVLGLGEDWSGPELTDTGGWLQLRRTTGLSRADRWFFCSHEHLAEWVANPANAELTVIAME